jgi:hypothetical protein
MMSPKGRFLTNPTRVAEHRHIIVQPTFLDAIDAAMLQYANSMDDRVVPDVTSGVLLKGAREFVKVFMSLTEQPTMTPRKDVDNLKNV